MAASRNYTPAYNRAMWTLLALFGLTIVGSLLAAMWGLVAWGTAGKVVLTAAVLWTIGVIVAGALWGRAPRTPEIHMTIHTDSAQVAREVARKSTAHLRQEDRLR